MDGKSGNSRASSRVTEETGQIKRQNNQDHQIQQNQLLRSRNLQNQQIRLRGNQNRSQVQYQRSQNVVRIQSIENRQIQRDENQNCQQVQQAESFQIQMIQPINQSNSQHQQQNSLSQPISQKLPILYSIRNHSVRKISLTPNFTRISFIEYAPYCKNYAFSNANIEYLQNHDISHVQSIKIQCQQMKDEIFSKMSLLPWKNIISLQIDDNSLTNLDPLRNFHLDKLVHLDISMNEFNIRSAQLLAISSFDELIYFTVSFVTGINNECWQVLLRNGMKNFPKLEAIDICNSNQLDKKVTQKIVNCMKVKSAEQRKRMKLDQNGQLVPIYPPNYEIKIKWQQSKQTLQKRTEKQAQQLNQKWIEEVDYKYEQITKSQIQRESTKKRSRRRGRGSRGRGSRGIGRGLSRGSQEQENQHSQISIQRQGISRSISENRRKIIHKSN